MNRFYWLSGISYPPVRILAVAGRACPLLVRTNTATLPAGEFFPNVKKLNGFRAEKKGRIFQKTQQHFVSAGGAPSFGGTSYPAPVKQGAEQAGVPPAFQELQEPAKQHIEKIAKNPVALTGKEYPQKVPAKSYGSITMVFESHDQAEK